MVHGCHTFVPRSRAQKKRCVIIVASAAGLISFPQMTPYNATEAAAVAMSESMSAGCRCSYASVAPIWGVAR